MSTTTFITFVLTLTEPGGVLVPLPPEKEKATLVPDTGADGRPHIPGTSLAGALRELVRTGAPAYEADWFGEVKEDTADDETAGVPSRVWVYGARLPEQAPGVEPVAVKADVRTSTAVDRTRAAARNYTLRTEELLPVGTALRARLRWDDAPPDQLTALLNLIAGWRPLLGHGVSRGRGRCTVSDIRHGTVDLSTPDGLLTWLTGSGPTLADQIAQTSHTVEEADVPPLYRLPVTVTGPLRIGTGTTVEENGRQIAEIARDADGKPVVLGSGLKGVLRSRVEYVLRSVGLPACCEQDCGDCLPCSWFGYAKRRSSSTQDANQPDTSGHSARSRLRVPDAPLHDCVTDTRTHVAIDRFTGGAAGQSPDLTEAGIARAAAKTATAVPAGRGLLYTVRTVERGTFDLVIEALPGHVADPLLSALLRLAVEDLNDGLTGIGGGTARGYGSITVDPAGLPSLADARAALRGAVDAA